MAAERQIEGDGALIVPLGQPLIVLPMVIDGNEVECYFADEASADAAVSEDDLRASMDAIGAWCVLDWDDLEGAIERSRRERTPSPPIDE
jgi:hypothetical protein